MSKFMKSSRRRGSSHRHGESSAMRRCSSWIFKTTIVKKKLLWTKS